MILCGVVVYIVSTQEFRAYRPGERTVEDSLYRVKVNRRETCYKLFKFAETPLNVTALASFPRSGNTWTRRMLTEATGLYTGTVYNDPRKPGDIQYPPVTPITNGSVIVVKTHQPDDANTRFHRAIVLLRNPYDSLSSQFCLRIKRDRCHQIANRTEKLISSVSKSAHDWHSFYMSWFQLRGPLLIVLYEDLIKDQEKELRKMIRFLGFPETRIHCAIDRLPMQTHSLISPAKRIEKVSESRMSETSPGEDVCDKQWCQSMEVG
ncbi:WSC domain-containing protein 2-like [Lamellibrachia satsuma]|nr:WSC domain-containing protein 2-like [Lamellibrachia satsuma]